MNGKKRTVLWAGMAAALVLALLVAALLPGCDRDADEDAGFFFQAKLRGTWETLNPALYDYSGTLVIGWDTITITGYEQLYYYPNDPQRPFKDIMKGVARKGYSEDGKLYINDFGWKEGIAYTYDAAPDYTKLLRFTFGGREERLRKTDG
jgi:hypothetical protein